LQGITAGQPVTVRIVAQLKMGQDSLCGEVWVELPGIPAPVAFLAQAEAFSAEEGGHVQVRPLNDSAGGQAIWQWDRKGHFLQWSVDVPATNRYELLMRYHATDKATRRLAIDGADAGQLSFLATRGLGDKPQDWDEITFADQEGKPMRLERGRHTIRLENTDAHGLDLDYLGFARGR
jgi:hypothetical protein